VNNFRTLFIEFRDRYPELSTAHTEKIALCYKHIVQELQDLERGTVRFHQTYFTVSPRITRFACSTKIKRLIDNVQELKAEFRAVVSVRAL
jgi:hypothetical protein